jgi:hypothetical protein
MNNPNSTKRRRTERPPRPAQSRGEQGKHEAILFLLKFCHDRQACPNGHGHGQFGRCGRRRQSQLHFWVWQYHQFRSIERSIAIGPKQPTTLSVRFVRGTTLWYSLYRPTRPQQTFMVVPHSSIRAGKTVLLQVPLMFVCWCNFRGDVILAGCNLSFVCCSSSCI